nr:YnjH family protein [Buttiauxella noackiae]
MQLRSVLAAAVALMVTLPVMAQRLDPQVDISVPPEVFSSQGQRAAPCNQCCIYQDQNYSEGAVVKADGGVLLQCQRDEKTLSTNPLVWRRVRT